MTSDQKARLDRVRDEIKPKDLHFRRECDDNGWKCGAHKSWQEGWNAAVEHLLPLIEACEFYASNEWEDNGKRARSAIAKVFNDRAEG